MPSFIYISDGKFHEVKTLDLIPLKAGALYILDRRFCISDCCHYKEAAESPGKSLHYFTGAERFFI